MSDPYALAVHSSFDEIEPDQLSVLTADDVIAAARTLGEEPEPEQGPRSFFRRH